MNRTIAELAAIAGQLDDEDDEHGLTDEQAITRLTEYFAQVFADEPGHFEPGEILWHKNAELADTHSAAGPHIFIGYLNEKMVAADYIKDSGAFGSNACARVYDCRIGCISQGTFSVYLMDSRSFESAAS